MPLSAVALAIFSIFSVFDQLMKGVLDFVFRNFFPAAGETVERHIREFAKQAASLSLPGWSSWW